MTTESNKEHSFQIKNWIGMRTIKTAIAVVIGMYVAKLLKLNTSIYITIAIVTTMQPSFYETYQSIRLRISTCIFGVMLGYILSIIPVPSIFVPVLGGLGVIIMIVFILKVIKQPRLVTLSVIIFMISFVMEHNQLTYGINRLFGTILGALISLAINYIIKSPKVDNQFVEVLEETYEEVCVLTKEVLFSKDEVDLEQLEADIQKANDYYDAVVHELTQPLAGVEEPNHSMEAIEDFNEIFLLLQLLVEMPDEMPAYTKKNKRLIEKLYNYTIVEEGDMEDVPNTVTNFHIQALLERLIRLRAYYKEGFSHERK